MMRVALVVFVVAALCSCTTTSKAQLDALIGKRLVDATISFKKAPTDEADLGDGARIYTWRWPIAGTGPGVTGHIMHEIVTLWVATDGTITRWQRSAE